MELSLWKSFPQQTSSNSAPSLSASSGCLCFSVCPSMYLSRSYSSYSPWTTTTTEEVSIKQNCQISHSSARPRTLMSVFNRSQQGRGFFRCSVGSLATQGSKREHSDSWSDTTSINIVHDRPFCVFERYFFFKKNKTTLLILSQFSLLTNRFFFSVGCLLSLFSAT